MCRNYSSKNLYTLFVIRDKYDFSFNVLFDVTFFWRVILHRICEWLTIEATVRVNDLQLSQEDIMWKYGAGARANFSSVILFYRNWGDYVFTYAKEEIQRVHIDRVSVPLAQQYSPFYDKSLYCISNLMILMLPCRRYSFSFGLKLIETE